jgi:hypothetical protein
MRNKGSQKPADDDSSLNNKSSSEQADQSDGTTDEALANSASDEIIALSGDGNGAGKMATNTLIETDSVSTRDKAPSYLNEDVDWSLTGILNNPSGVDQALKNNLAMMEQQTRDLIETGSVEDLLRALDENTRQLEMLRDRMEGNLSWLTNLA